MHILSAIKWYKTFDFLFNVVPHTSYMHYYNDGSAMKTFISLIKSMFNICIILAAEIVFCTKYCKKKQRKKRNRRQSLAFFRLNKSFDEMWNDWIILNSFGLLLKVNCFQLNSEYDFWTKSMAGGTINGSIEQFSINIDHCKPDRQTNELNVQRW